MAFYCLRERAGQGDIWFVRSRAPAGVPARLEGLGQDRSQGCLPLSEQVWLFRQKPESLDPLTKYLSATTGFGSNYVTTQKVTPLAPLEAAPCTPAPAPEASWLPSRGLLSAGTAPAGPVSSWAAARLLSPRVALTVLCQLLGFSCSPFRSRLVSGLWDPSGGVSAS